MFELQRFVMPHLAFGAPEQMYVRLNERCRANLETKIIHFERDGIASFDTFFNSLTIHAWKKHCAIPDLILSLAGSGRFALRFGLQRMGYQESWLSEEEIYLTDGEALKVDLAFWDRLDVGMLFVSLRALGPGHISGGAFLTRATPRRDVRLGIVITHFNRKQYVLPAMERMRKDLLSDPLYQDKIDLIVVDNSRNVTEAEGIGVTVIPNENFGGSGGFSRGLLHLIDRTVYSHCLFMDDDASCEIESIRRAYALLQYTTQEKFAVAGSILREIEPNTLYEKGARIGLNNQPLKHGLNMNDIQDLLVAEIHDLSIDYGGWWFFAFKISEVEQFPFPFFVRGDDILFSLQNKFNIMTMNGIACWCEDFVSKEVPLHKYLETRSYFVLSFLMSRGNRRSAFFAYFGRFFRSVQSYKYASARAVTLAVQHVMTGPELFTENLDTSLIRNQIGALSPSEKKSPVERYKFDIAYARPRETKLRYLLRQISLNGLLLPDFMYKNRTIFQHMNWSAIPREIFLYKKIYFEYEPLSIGHVTVFDRRRAFQELALFAVTAFRLMRDFYKLKDIYLREAHNYTTPAFWQKVYAKQPDDGATSSEP